MPSFRRYAVCGSEPGVRRAAKLDSGCVCTGVHLQKDMGYDGLAVVIPARARARERAGIYFRLDGGGPS
jgi:hypothetical protein